MDEPLSVPVVPVKGMPGSYVRKDNRWKASKGSLSREVFPMRPLGEHKVDIPQCTHGDMFSRAVLMVHCSFLYFKPLFLINSFCYLRSTKIFSSSCDLVKKIASWWFWRQGTPIPFRTQKLSPSAPMVLGFWSWESRSPPRPGLFFFEYCS